jgi:hypothetical protein
VFLGIGDGPPQYGVPGNASQAPVVVEFEQSASVQHSLPEGNGTGQGRGKVAFDLSAQYLWSPPRGTASQVKEEELLFTEGVQSESEVQRV